MTRWLADRMGADAATVIDDGTGTASAISSRARESESTELQHAMPQREVNEASGKIERAKLSMTRAGLHVSSYAVTRPWRMPLNFFTMYPVTPGGWDTVTTHAFERTKAMLSPRRQGPNALLLGSPFISDGFASHEGYTAMVRAVVAEFGDVSYVPHRRETIGPRSPFGPGVAVISTRDCVELAIEREVGVPRTVIGFSSTALESLCLLYDGIGEAIDTRPSLALFTSAGHRFVTNRTDTPAVSGRVRAVMLSPPDARATRPS